MIRGLGPINGFLHAGKRMHYRFYRNTILYLILGLDQVPQIQSQKQP